jgi:hypothetical protein
MKLSILITVLSFAKTLLTSLNAVYSASSSPRKLKMSLMPFMKDLKRDLAKEGIEELCKKEKGLEGFSNIIEHLHYTAVPPSWPLSGFDSTLYNSDFPVPYKNFLNLNRQTHPSTYQSRKENRTDIWRSRNGTGKRRIRILPVATGLIGYQRTKRVTTTPSFSLLHYLAETFIDNYFSDLL